MFPALKAVRDSLERSYFAAQSGVEAHAAELLKTDPEAAKVYLNDYTVSVAGNMMKTWKALRTYLVVKYNDMSVKPDKNGRFLRTPEGIGATVERPGYPEKYARKYVKETGDKYLYPEEKK
jgi:hypothetical protein